jgi:hypothetical protein
MAIKKQKFQRGDVVTIANEMPSFMSHFRCGCNAVVLGTYNDFYGKSKIDRYALHLEPDEDGHGGGHSSWYHECQLTLVIKNSLEYDELPEWCKVVSL